MYVCKELGTRVYSAIVPRSHAHGLQEPRKERKEKKTRSWCRLQIHLRQRFERIFIRIQERLHARPLRNDRLVLIQQALEHIGFIQSCHQPILDLSRRMVDEEVHDSFGDEVLDGLPHDAEVRRDEVPNEGRFHFFACGDAVAVDLFAEKMGQNG